jgi:transcriptional regulator with XRE-family HTH domain
MQIGKVIYGLRTRKKLTVDELAEKSGISKNFIIGIESGKYDPTFNTLLMIAKGLDITIQELMFATENDELDKLKNENEKLQIKLNTALKEIEKLKAKSFQPLPPENEILQFIIDELRGYLKSGTKEFRKADQETFDYGVSLGIFIMSFHILYELENKFGIELPKWR